MMSLWDALRMNMMISYQELVRTFPNARSLPLLRVNGLAGHRWQGGKSSDTQTVRKGQYQG
ncbi:hypothetical protein CI612_15630 [Klebsiella quasipneumoniae subsp. similipneumoniae]|nr:hypothetical protein CI612_15630 [Klebsiella quasipneumoniae subsp. similipneumoniae]